MADQPPQVGEQQSLFRVTVEDPPLEEHTVQRAESWLDQADVDGRRYTKEPIHLADLPLGVSVESKAKSIQVTIDAPDGQKQVVTYPGKVLHRYVPSPDKVRVGHEVVDRMEAKGSRHHEIFVHLRTQILYTLGQVSPLHYEIFLAIVHLWWQRYLSHRTVSSEVTFTRSDIAQALGLEEGANSGHLRAEIPKALRSVKGLQITKDWRSEESDVPPVSMIGASLLDWAKIEGISLEELYSGPSEGSPRKPHRGNRPERITVALGQTFINSILGRESGRHELAVRTLRLDQMRGHAGWRQNLYRVIELRLERHQEVSIPLEELWVHVLGMSPEDIQVPARWRKVRLRMRETFREWAAADYISYQATRTRDGDGVYNLHSRPYTVARLIDGQWQPVPCEGGDWVVVARGPNFLEGRPLSRSEVNERMIQAMGAGGENASWSLRQIGEATVIAARAHLMDVLSDIGEDQSRLTTWGWWQPGYPLPSMRDTLRRALLRARTRRQVGDLDIDGRPKIQQERALVSSLLMQRIMRASDNRPGDYLEQASQAQPPGERNLTRQVWAEHQAGIFYQEALTLFLQRAGHTVDDFHEWRRTNDANLEGIWERYRADAALAAMMAAGELAWFHSVREEVERQLKAARRSVSAYEMLLEQAIARFGLMNERAFLTEWKGEGSSPFMRLAAETIECRIMECYIEAERLREVITKSRSRDST